MAAFTFRYQSTGQLPNGSYHMSAENNHSAQNTQRRQPLSLCPGHSDSTARPNDTIHVKVASTFFLLLKDNIRNKHFSSVNSFENVAEGMM